MNLPLKKNNPIWNKQWLGLFGSLGIFLFLTTCQSEVVEDTRVLGFQYYPLEIGRFVEYEVELITYSLSAPRETITNYQLREELAAAFVDVNGEVAYRLERYKRDNVTQAWSLDSTWSVRRNNFNLTRNENSQVFVKLAFPVKDGLQWNGNLYNNYNKATYSIQNFGKPLTINGIDFPLTLTVFRNDECSAVSMDYRSEIFAENVGIIQKHDWQIKYVMQGTCTGIINNYCDTDIKALLPNKPNPDCVQSGRIYTQKMINYGIR